MKTNKILYQWDAGQKLTDCRGVFVDFVISGEVYRCDVVNGECIVPDELLQHPGKQTAYECMADNTLQEFVFSVVPRPLPPDYVYTPTEKLTFEGLVQKVDDTVADIIRRADSGEFDGYTPVKGKDYFTESEKNEMMQRVSDGAIGEFREVVDSATAGFNKNSSAKTNDYNANAEKKVGVYDSNAAEKLKAYNDNHTEKMTAYDANAADKLSTYNSNAEQKLESYNQNHTEKVAEYNQNAETKTAEFDSNAAALQTEVDRLRGECDNLADEIVDARLGADGVTYPSLGAAIRYQFTDLKSDLVDFGNVAVLFNSKETEPDISESLISFPNTDQGINPDDGTLMSDTGYAVSDYIDLTDVTGIYRTGTTTKFNLWGYAFYDSNKNFLSYTPSTTDYEFDTHDGKQVTWLNLDNSARFIRILFEMSRTAYIYYKVTSKERIVKYDVPYMTFNGEDLLQNKSFRGKTIVNFGDSIFGNKRPPTDISTKLAEITGATVYNLGFGGCRMCRDNGPWDAFAMYQLANAIASNDFSIQDAVDVSSVSGMPSYFGETRTLLKSIDFNNVDIITIAYGTNDFTSGRQLDSTSDMKNIIFFGGALRHSIETILTAYPHLKIFICGQTYRFWMDSSNEFIDDSDTHTNSNGNTLIDYINKTKEIANEYHIPFIDNYFDLGINKFNRSHWFPSNDGTHHNELGGKLIAEHMAKEMF